MHEGSDGGEELFGTCEFLRLQRLPHARRGNLVALGQGLHERIECESGGHRVAPAQAIAERAQHGGMQRGATVAREGELAGRLHVCKQGALVQRLAGRLTGFDPGALPHAADLARLAARDFGLGRAIAADALEPAYLRDKVALTLAEQGKPMPR